MQLTHVAPEKARMTATVILNCVRRRQFCAGLVTVQSSFVTGSTTPMLYLCLRRSFNIARVARGAQCRERASHGSCGGVIICVRCSVIDGIDLEVRAFAPAECILCNEVSEGRPVANVPLKPQSD